MVDITIRGSSSNFRKDDDAKHMVHKCNDDDLYSGFNYNAPGDFIGPVVNIYYFWAMSYHL